MNPLRTIPRPIIVMCALCAMLLLVSACQSSGDAAYQPRQEGADSLELPLPVKKSQEEAIIMTLCEELGGTCTPTPNTPFVARCTASGASLGCSGECYGGPHAQICGFVDEYDLGLGTCFCEGNVCSEIGGECTADPDDFWADVTCHQGYYINNINQLCPEPEVAGHCAVYEGNYYYDTYLDDYVWGDELSPLYGCYINGNNPVSIQYVYVSAPQNMCASGNKGLKCHPEAANNFCIANGYVNGAYRGHDDNDPWAGVGWCECPSGANCNEGGMYANGQQTSCSTMHNSFWAQGANCKKNDR